MMQGFSLILRSMIKGRFYSFVLVAGLSIAIAVVILVSALVQHELAYEKGFSNSDRIYRLNWSNSGTGDQFATMFNPFSPPLAAQTPEIESAARVGTAELLLSRESETTGEQLNSFELLAFVDPGYFEIFDFPFIEGTAATALTTPDSLVLSQAAARKLFPDQSALGKTLLLESELTLTVSGVIEDMPAATHFPFHFIVPLDVFRTIFNGAGWLDNWGSDALYHYILLNEGADPDIVHQRILEFSDRNMPFDDWDFGIQMQALEDIHFTTNLQNEMEFHDTIHNRLKTPRERSDLLLFSAGALVLVLIASFNFMNLQIARSVRRSRQMGILKVVGASRRQVVQQILTESIFFSVLSLLVALLLVEISLGSFSQILAVSLTWSDILQQPTVLFVISLTLALGLFSGSYPAYMIATQKPSQALKGEFSETYGAGIVRQALVLLQFTVSIVLIVVSLGIFAQIQYSISAPLGFEQDDTAIVRINRREVQGDYETLRNRILEHPDVTYVSRASIIPTGNLSDGTSMHRQGESSDSDVAMRRVGTDFDYFAAFGMEMVAGRSFQRDFPADVFVFPSAEVPTSHVGIILNETAARRLGWDDPQQAIGQIVQSDFNYDETDVSIVMTIVGVARNVNYRSLRSEIVPMSFSLENRGGRMIVKHNGLNEDKVTQHIEQVWQEVVPEIPIRLEWLSTTVGRMYNQESRIVNLLAGISAIAVFVACLGLFAVASLITNLRTREVGLRKVFGATLAEIINLLSWQFMKPVLLASLLAIPIAWIYMNDWLQAFVYRIELGALHFLIPAVITILIAWITVAGKAWAVAHKNPIHALRHE